MTPSDTHFFQFLHVFSFETTGCDCHIQPELFSFHSAPSHNNFSEPRIQCTFVLKPAFEKRSDTFDITIEIPRSMFSKKLREKLWMTPPLSIFVRSADHLRKIYDNGYARLALDENIEFIEVPMD